MSTQTIQPSAWDDIPGGDIPLDTLFPADGSGYPTADTTPPAATSQPPAAAPQAPATQAQPPAQPAPAAPADGAQFLGTYKNREDAERGLAEKDRIIQQLRDAEIKRSGVDPITGRPVNLQPTSDSYIEHPERYWDDLSTAAQKGDKVGYVRAQAKFISEVLGPTLQSVTPILQNTAKQQALDTLGLQIKTPEGQSVPEVRSFIGSQDYQSVLSENPLLKNAIENAESNFQLSSQLPELYRMAYGLSQYRKQPDLLKAAATTTVAPTAATPTPPVRPTASPSTMPAPSATVSAPDVHTSDGRKEMIKRFEQQGIMDVKF